MKNEIMLNLIDSHSEIWFSLIMRPTKTTRMMKRGKMAFLERVTEKPIVTDSLTQERKHLWWGRLKCLVQRK